MFLELGLFVAATFLGSFVAGLAGFAFGLYSLLKPALRPMAHAGNVADGSAGIECVTLSAVRPDLPHRANGVGQCTWLDHGRTTRGFPAGWAGNEAAFRKIVLGLLLVADLTLLGHFCV